MCICCRGTNSMKAATSAQHFRIGKFGAGVSFGADMDSTWYYRDARRVSNGGIEEKCDDRAERMERW